ncbi:MAG TPA: HAD-IA family hydrolase [Marinobacterium sp.]|nr:HAD-IA family hydrolase [Marinobacterium sp.]
MAAIEAVLFDLDGTLLDTAPDFYRIMIELQQVRDMSPVPFEALRTRASDGSRAMLKLAFGEDIQELHLEPLVREFLQLYETKPVASGALFDGVPELLTHLEMRSLPWGIVTNKPRYLSERVLESLELSERCAVLICPEDVSQSKPSPEGLLLAAKQLNVRAENCLYLGDHQRDIDAGRAAGMITIACGFGYLKPDEHASDWRADLLIHRSEDLPQFIGELLA